MGDNNIHENIYICIEHIRRLAHISRHTKIVMIIPANKLNFFDKDRRRGHVQLDKD